MRVLKKVGDFREDSLHPPRWLRSKHVRQMLNISDSTLQNLRISGCLPAYKLGASWFYRENEIMEALERGKIRKEVDHG